MLASHEQYNRCTASRVSRVYSGTVEISRTVGRWVGACERPYRVEFKWTKYDVCLALKLGMPFFTF